MVEQKKNFWTKVKDFFNVEEPVEKQDQTAKPIEEQVSAHPNRELKECFFCKEWIKEGDRWSKQMNHWFHRPCYKKFLQAGRGGVL